jgi:Fe-S-cluster containining protein
MQFEFQCCQCGKCCRHYKLLITVYDAIVITDSTKKKFLDSFCFIKSENITDNPEYDKIILDTGSYYLAIRQNSDGCVFQKNSVCSIHQFKPYVCYFYPVKYDFEKKTFEIKKYDICSGRFEGVSTQWNDIENKIELYRDHFAWSSEIISHWNKYYTKSNSYKYFIIYYYETVFPLFIEYKKTLDKKKE